MKRFDKESALSRSTSLWPKLWAGRFVWWVMDHYKLGAVRVPLLASWVIGMSFGVALRAETEGSLASFCEETVTEVVRAWKTGEREYYGSGFSYHIPAGYDREQRKRLNSHAWGFGAGRVVVAPGGTEHSLYALSFRDSHRHFEFHAGYKYLRRVGGEIAGLAVWAGYSAFVFSRRDIQGHLPLPGALPVVAVGAKRFRVNATFVPRLGGIAKGDTVFAFITLVPHGP